jgi:tRNA nucleotidyltransferase (CCA-adding enzyme)
MSDWQAPDSVEAACAVLRKAEVEAPILEVLKSLKSAGFAASLVGGAVRDILCGRVHGDWDIATSAKPEEVIALFRRTVPTGLAHGTVTVLVGRGKPIPVEVTTFRGEGAYHDGRRPSQVYFLQDLREDLARRDFTINACAWDPIDEVFTDPFGGLEDLRRRCIRAVGDPLARFREDGLRTMRAVRFAAVLECSVDDATLAAIEPSLDVFAKVARERVRTEAFKLLEAHRPSIGLRAMAASGLWPQVFGSHTPALRESLIPFIESLPASAPLRLCGLLRALNEVNERESVLSALKPSRSERDYVLDLAAANLERLVSSTSPAEIRKMAAGIGRLRLDHGLLLARANAETTARVESACAGAPLSVGELALGAKYLIQEGLAKPGPELGVLLQHLLDAVLEEPALNTEPSLRKWVELRRANAT